MTYHNRSDRTPRGHRPNQRHGQDTSPRISISLPADTMMALAKYAGSQRIPVASIVRDAIEQYLHRQGMQPDDC